MVRGLRPRTFSKRGQPATACAKPPLKLKNILVPKNKWAAVPAAV